MCKYKCFCQRRKIVDWEGSGVEVVQNINRFSKSENIKEQTIKTDIFAKHTKSCAKVPTKNGTICSLNWIEKCAAYFKINQLKKELRNRKDCLFVIAHTSDMPNDLKVDNHPHCHWTSSILSPRSSRSCMSWIQANVSISS